MVDAHMIARYTKNFGPINTACTARTRYLSISILLKTHHSIFSTDKTITTNIV